MIITVAGVASRFSQSVSKPCLKCIYYKNNIKESLLYHILYQNSFVDKFVIVGGFKFDELKQIIHTQFQEFQDRIILIENEHYKEYGSGYSLYLGLNAIKNFTYDDLVFAEGDLWVDDDSFNHIWKTTKNVVTYNNEIILANKSVAFYFDCQYHIHYIFDTAHSILEIKEPFLGIFNSGQIWKFSNQKQIATAMDCLTLEDWAQTNLKFIQQYFGDLSQDEYSIIELKQWVNCNTIDDFEKIERLR